MYLVGGFYMKNHFKVRPYGPSCSQFTFKMMLNVKSVKNRLLRRFLEHIVYIGIIVLLVPAFLYFELCIVLPVVTEAWTIQYYIHIVCATFFMLNIIGNLIFGAFTETSIRGKFFESANNNNWTFCAVCECMRPSRAWHCEYCNICILKRDHHCTFFATCIGYYNHRYFLMFTMHVFFAMLYCFYFNVKFAFNFISWNHGLVIAKFVLPLVGFLFDYENESTYIFMLVINFIVAAFTGFLCYYHFDNVIKGKTTPERKHYTNDFVYDKGWKSNLEEVLGMKWYLTWLLPFIYSPLPGNGIEWPEEYKHK